MKTETEKIDKSEIILTILLGLTILAACYITITLWPVIIFIPFALFTLFFFTPVGAIYLFYRLVRALERRNRDEVT